MRHLSVGHAEPLRSELLAFLSAVRAGAEPAVTGEQGVASLEIATRCLTAPAMPFTPSHRAAPRVAAG
jgi:predicted dehydrogenase